MLQYMPLCSLSSCFLTQSFLKAFCSPVPYSILQYNVTMSYCSPVPRPPIHFPFVPCSPFPHPPIPCPPVFSPAVSCPPVRCPFDSLSSCSFSLVPFSLVFLFAMIHHLYRAKPGQAQRDDIFSFFVQLIFGKQGNNSKIHLHVAYFFAVENKSPNFHIKIREQKICRR